VKARKKSSINENENETMIKKIQYFEEENKVLEEEKAK